MRHLLPAHVAQKTLHLDAHDRSLSGLRPIQSSQCLGIILLFLLSGLNDYLCKESQRQHTESSKSSVRRQLRTFLLRRFQFHLAGSGVCPDNDSGVPKNK